LGGAACLAAGWLFSAIREEGAEIFVLDVGQGDAILLRHAGRTVLVDAGPGTDGRIADRVIIPRLRRLGADLDWILVTHPDQDHIGGLPAVLRRYPKARIAANAAFRQHSQLLSALYGGGRKPDEVLWVRAKASVSWGTARLDLVVPPTWAEDDNGASLVAHLAVGNSRAVFTADLPMAGEEALVPTGDFSAQVCLSGHHGSAGSLSPAWLSEVRPKWVVASCGRDNRYGHPASETVRRAEAAGAAFLRTDRDGELRFRSSPAGFVLVGKGRG
jgi:competence protein ComEC